MYGQLVNYYATVPAPPTIAELIDKLDERYGIEMPLVDLFMWGYAPIKSCPGNHQRDGYWSGFN